MLSISLVNPQVEPSVVEEFFDAQRACYEEYAAGAAVSEVAQDELMDGRVVYVVARNERAEMVGGLRLLLAAGCRSKRRCRSCRTSREC